MPCTHQLARARQQDTCHLCGFDLRGGSDQRLVLPIRLGEHPTRYFNWKSHFKGWTQREEEIAHAAYIAGWYHRCNQDPDAMGENDNNPATGSK